MPTRADIVALAHRITESAIEGRTVRLAPSTALLVGRALRVYDQPALDRDEIAHVICWMKCTSLCLTCRGEANVRMLDGDDEPPPNPPSAPAAARRALVKLRRAR